MNLVEMSHSLSCFLSIAFAPTPTSRLPRLHRHVGCGDSRKEAYQNRLEGELPEG